MFDSWQKLIADNNVWIIWDPLLSNRKEYKNNRVTGVLEPYHRGTLNPACSISINSQYSVRAGVDSAALSTIAVGIEYQGMPPSRSPGTCLLQTRFLPIWPFGSSAFQAEIARYDNPQAVIKWVEHAIFLKIKGLATRAMPF